MGYWLQHRYECDGSNSPVNKCHLDLGTFYVKQVEAVKNGTWTSERYWGGLDDGIIGLAPYNQAVPQEVKDLVDQWHATISAKEWDVFDGPLYGQDGRLVRAEGQRFDDAYLLNDMDWFVKGIVGDAGELPEAVKP